MLRALIVDGRSSDASASHILTSHNTMGSAYTIFGKSVPAHWLAIATLSATIGGTVFATAGPKPVAAAVGAPAAVPAAKDEEFDLEKIIKYVCNPPQLP